jgi:hypothetical protein
MCRARRSKAKKEKQALIDPHGAFRSAPSIRVSNFRVPVAAYKRNGAEAGAVSVRPESSAWRILAHPTSARFPASRKHASQRAIGSPVPGSPI